MAAVSSLGGWPVAINYTIVLSMAAVSSVGGWPVAINYNIVLSRAAVSSLGGWPVAMNASAWAQPPTLEINLANIRQNPLNIIK